MKIFLEKFLLNFGTFYNFYFPASPFSLDWEKGVSENEYKPPIILYANYSSIKAGKAMSEYTSIRVTKYTSEFIDIIKASRKGEELILCLL
ncbi:MAG: hypothetical protein QXF82_08785 [Nitrososphaeria archaeon]